MREELEALRRAQQSANGGESERISRDQFDTEDEYLDAVIELRQAKREAQNEPRNGMKTSDYSGKGRRFRH